MTIDPKKSGASPLAPKWGNWSGNIVHESPTNGANYYFRPTNLVELKSVLADAVTMGVTVRASGQRHSQPPLVTNDNRGAVPPLPTTYLVDMSCYGSGTGRQGSYGSGARTKPGHGEPRHPRGRSRRVSHQAQPDVGYGNSRWILQHRRHDCGRRSRRYGARADLRRGSIRVHNPGRRRQRNNHQ